MMGNITLWYSYALHFPRKRSADFQISFARLSSFCLLRLMLFMLLFCFSFNGFRHVHPPQRQQSFIPRVKFLVMLVNEAHQFFAIHQAEVALIPSEGSSLIGERPESH